MVCEICEVIELDILDYDDEEITIDVDFEGEFVSGNTGEEYQNGYNKGHDDGHKLGYTEGKTDGATEGYNQGVTEGYNNGHKQGYTEGKTEGITEGYTQGKDEGYNEGKADGVTEGYNQGKTDGYNEGHEAGYAEGHKDGYDEAKAEGDSYYDTFWDYYQQNGERVSYGNAFAGKGWTKDTFKPKYNFNLNGFIFYNSAIKVDLVKYLDELGVVFAFDDPKAINYERAFSYSEFTRLGELDLTNIGMHLLSGFCDNMPNLTRIDKIKTKQRFFDDFSEAIFRNSSKLAYVRFEGGLFTKNTIFKTLPLDADTAKHIIGLLTNYAGTDKEFSFTITFSPTTWGYLDAEGETASPNGNSWREYILDLGWMYS